MYKTKVSILFFTVICFVIFIVSTNTTFAKENDKPEKNGKPVYFEYSDGRIQEMDENNIFHLTQKDEGTFKAREPKEGKKWSALANCKTPVLGFAETRKNYINPTTGEFVANKWYVVPTWEYSSSGQDGRFKNEIPFAASYGDVKFKIDLVPGSDKVEHFFLTVDPKDYKTIGNFGYGRMIDISLNGVLPVEVNKEIKLTARAYYGEEYKNFVQYTSKYLTNDKYFLDYKVKGEHIECKDGVVKATDKNAKGTITVSLKSDPKISTKVKIVARESKPELCAVDFSWVRDVKSNQKYATMAAVEKGQPILNFPQIKEKKIVVWTTKDGKVYKPGSIIEDTVEIRGFRTATKEEIEEIERLTAQDKLQEVTEALEEAKDKLEEKTKELHKATEELNKAKKDLDKATEDLDKAKKDLDNVTEELNKLKEEKEKLIKTLESLKTSEQKSKEDLIKADDARKKAEKEAKESKEALEKFKKEIKKAKQNLKKKRALAKKSKVKKFKVKSKKNRIYVSWSKVKGATGYQVSYIKKGKFTYKTMKMTKSFKANSAKLKKGSVYAVIIRPYTILDDGSSVYGRYTNAKSVRIR